jgi:hypothetical protein
MCLGVEFATQALRGFPDFVGEVGKMGLIEMRGGLDHI